jgi:hypothetical protein
MKVLYVGLKFNYGKREEGFSYEHMNIEAGIRDCMKRGTLQADFYWPDMPDRCEINGEESVLHPNDKLGLLNNHIDAVFHVAFNESLDLPEDVAKLAIKRDIPVIQWDCDSSWRFKNWVFPRRDRVTHFVTTHSATIPEYQRNGMKVIKSQWAGSPAYKAYEALYEYDTTFVGQKHGQMPNGKFLRSEIVDAMMAAGIKLDLFGNYWDGYANWHGYRQNFEDIIRVFNCSRVNLNLSNPWHHGTMPQIKGRHFEIPQCGGFQISTPADDLETYFVPGKEIVIVNSVQDLIEKTKYYLEHADEREAIANAGHERMLAEHQWHHRFQHIFQEVGLL